jgi:hypothetical protein
LLVDDGTLFALIVSVVATLRLAGPGIALAVTVRRRRPLRQR